MGTNFRYTKEHERFVMEHVDLKVPEITKAFNAHFGTDKKYAAIGVYLNKLGINKIQHNKKFKTHIIEWLKENAEGKSNDELIKILAEKFGIHTTKSSLYCALSRYGIKTHYRHSNALHLRHLADNQTLPVGTERVFDNDFIYVKTDIVRGTKKNKTKRSCEWKMKHHIVWEQKHGRIPNDHNILFLDRNKRNFSIKNLICVDRRVTQMIVASNTPFTEDPKINLANIRWAELVIATREVKL